MVRGAAEVGRGDGMKPSAFLLSCLLGLGLTGCGLLTVANYRGDGEIVDNGFLAYSRRYQVDLGVIDTTRVQERTFVLKGLPHSQMVVGLEVTETVPNSFGEDRTYIGVVEIVVRNALGEVVVSEVGSLNQWVRERGMGSLSSRFYQAGISRDIPLKRGGARVEAIGKKASGGWGTYFEADPAEKYTLTFRVLEPLDKKNQPTKLTLNGWDR